MERENHSITNFLKDRSSKNFLLLYHNHANNLMRTAMYLTKYNRDYAEDIVQDTWIVAIKKLDNFNARSSLGTWLTGILLNKYKESLKARKPIQALEVNIAIGEFSMKSDLAMDLKKAILKLPDGYRKILILYDIQGFKHREIGEILGIDEGTSKSQLSQARKKMRVLLNTYKT